MLRNMKMKNIIAISALVGVGISAQAITVDYTFLENGLGNLGPTSTFNEGGYSVTATGENDTLYGKEQGGDENGLGVATTDPDHEINTVGWVQLNISALSGASLAKIFLGSVTPPDIAEIYYSDTANTLGTLITSVTADGSVDITSYLSHKYIDVIAGAGNVLIDSLQANIPSNVPDGGTTAAMLGATLAGLGLVRRKLAA